MNAKKIMSAVLVALLAAALFVGAGAAATDYGTKFVYQNVSGLQGTWTNGANSITAIYDGTNGYFAGANIVEGTYTKVNGSEKDTIYVKYPAVTITGVAGEGTSAYLFIGGTYYKGSSPVEITNQSIDGLTYDLYLTRPNGVEEKIIDMANIENNIANFAVGEYSIRAMFKTDGFAVGTLVSDLITKPVTFKVAEGGDATITASLDQILKEENFKVIITGQPGIKYNVTFDTDDFNVPGNQIGLPGITATKNTTFEFTMPNTGSVEFVMAATADAETSEKITVTTWNAEEGKLDNQASVTLKVVKGTLTATTDAASYFVGDVVKISGTSTAGNIKNVTISGTNYKADITAKMLKVETGKEWSFELNTSDIKNDGKMLDVGTYTLTLNTTGDAKATVALVLKQPFISIVEAPEVIVQETDVEFIINAEAATEIQYYIFGTNFFFASNSSQTVEDVENQFIVELNETQTDDMDAGQYFAVFQHPMYDKVFNIFAEDKEIFLLGETEPLFSVNGRQTANAAQALCDALDSQNIDDMYVKYSFFVVGEDESFTIGEIPSEVAQGSTFVISGVSTSAAGDYVTVEMISTAFAAVPKETVGSAAFIAVTTQVAEDGTWEVTLDTSDLNVDEYSLKVACGDDTWKNVKINVVEGAPDTPDTPDTPDVPDTPDTPDTLTEPETPGFGALAALAGLGAVAVLLLRRE